MTGGGATVGKQSGRGNPFSVTARKREVKFSLFSVFHYDFILYDVYPSCIRTSCLVYRTALVLPLKPWQPAVNQKQDTPTRDQGE